MRDAGRRDATYEDLKALPADVMGQLVEGVLIATPRPAFGHGLVTSTLGVELGGPFGRGRGGPGGWLCWARGEGMRTRWCAWRRSTRWSWTWSPSGRRRRVPEVK
jgi:hypothetical protein